MQKMLSLFALLVIESIFLAACRGASMEPADRTAAFTQEGIREADTFIETAASTRIIPLEPVQGELPVTLDWNWGSEPPTIDPALATDGVSVGVVTNLFVGLTSLDEVGNVLPYLATNWQLGEDAAGNQTWTFHLREDIAWVKYNPATGETIQQIDTKGNPRFVNAHDVEYGVKRTINPQTASDYAYVLYIIKNAKLVNDGSPDVSLEDVGVQALDDKTVQFTLENPAPYFPSIASMWVTKPQPRWTIEQWRERWTETDVIATNGPYVLEGWIHGGELNLVKNPLWINADQVQIERVHGVMIEEESTAFALYENDELDTTVVPLSDIERVKADPQLSQELHIAPIACTYYYGFVNTKPPFDDARVRRAFSAAIDRQSLIDNLLKGGQIPATSFAPPGIFGAPDPGTVGQGYDPDLARRELQDYLAENNMIIQDFNDLNITLMHNTSESHAQIAGAIQYMWADTLGVEVRVENQEWAVYLDTMRNTTPVQDAPHIYRAGWCADYADENNWVHEVFNADAGHNRLRRGCTDPNCGDVELQLFDELTYKGQQDQDPGVRAELYARAEDILAREEAAYAPIYHYTTVMVAKPWLDRSYPILGAQGFYNWSIDWEAKQAARQ